MAVPPTIEQLRAWLGVSAATVPDDQLQEVLDGELANQAVRCYTDPYTDDLVLAVYRRVGRALSARGTPLGLTGDAEFGPARLPDFDSEVERYEGPLRRFAFA